MKTYKGYINFKTDYNNVGRRNHPTTITLEIRYKPGPLVNYETRETMFDQPIISICGEIYNTANTLEELKEIFTEHPIL